jgi:uncharacterized protein YhaN
MAVRISKIDIQDLGPVQRLRWTPVSLNVIYGKNEQGKTWIVEFLLRSLFKVTRIWNLRQLKGNGRITVSGLESKPVHFSPTSSKLEEYIDQHQELPADFTRLLVIKGAELSLAASTQSGKIDKQTLQHFLSNQDLLDRIEDRISATLKKTEIVEGLISGIRKGEIVQRDLLLKQLKDIDALFEQIGLGYSGGKRKALEMESEQLSREIGGLIKAKQHQAWQISVELNHLKADISGMNEEILADLTEKNRSYDLMREQLASLQEQLQTAERKSRHYGWLKTAVRLYREKLENLPSRPSFLLPLLSVISGVAGAWFILQNMDWPAVACVAAVLAAGGLYVALMLRYTARQAEREERVSIGKEFESRFGKSFNGLADLEILLEESQEDFAQVQVLKRQVQEAGSNVDRMKDQIRQLWNRWRAGEIPGQEEWLKLIQEAQERIAALKRTWQEKREVLAGLQVPASEYVQEDPGIAFDPAQLAQLNDQRQQIQNDVGEIHRKLDLLKQLICKVTGDPFDLDWENLILHLQQKRESVLKEYQSVTSEILGKLAVKQVLDRLRAVQEERISEGLTSPAMVAPLKNITGRYSQFRIHGDEILVMDDIHEFNLSDLSTGAQEQVLLALRLGFVSRLFDQKPLFLILDDAFQHSDWERRSLMIDTMVELARNGWQIIYFTMDDHIRDMFQEKGRILGDEFNLKTLN